MARLVYGVSSETNPSSFSDAFFSTEVKGIKWSDSMWSFLSRRKLHLGSLLLISWKEAISIKWVSKTGLILKESFGGIRHDWSVESLVRPTLLHVRMLSQHRNQRNKLKRFNLQFPLRKKLHLGSLLLVSWKEAIPIKWVSKRGLMLKERFGDIRHDWSMESLVGPTLLHFRMLSQHRNQRNKLKRFNLQFPL